MAIQNKLVIARRLSETKQNEVQRSVCAKHRPTLVNPLNVAFETYANRGLWQNLNVKFIDSTLGCLFLFVF
ncbi:hypothetical protein ACWIUD_08015 [Helicobacter sp. 23-1044]